VSDVVADPRSTARKSSSTCQIKAIGLNSSAKYKQSITLVSFLLRGKTGVLQGSKEGTYIANKKRKS
jgi:hypothetical protein